MMKIAIRGVGVLGRFGVGVQALENSLENRLVNMKEPFETPDSDEMPGGAVGVVDTTALQNYIPKRSLRRIDHFSRMALLGAHLALEDANVSEVDPEKTGVVIATGYGALKTTFSFLDSFIEKGDKLAAPTHFSNSVSNAAAAHISIHLGITGPSLTVSQFDMSVSLAFLNACRWLEEKRVDAVLVGAVDEYCDVAGYCHKAFSDEIKGTSSGEKKAEKEKEAAGEGASFFLLTRDEAESPSYGYVKDVFVGNYKRDGIDVPDSALVYLGSGNCIHGENGYVDHITAGREVQASFYGPVYGDYPTNSAIDIAIAALSIKNGNVFGSFPPLFFDMETCGSTMRCLTEDNPLGKRDISCIKPGDNESYTMVSLGPFRE